MKSTVTSLIALIGTVVALAACTPADEQYCNGFGVGGTAEYGKCLDYFHQQDSWFKADLAQCSAQADQTYPPTLYDRGTMVQAMPTYWAGRYQTPEIIDVPPDAVHNAEVDRLRARIIDPCMYAKGWNSGSSWQAGRHAVTVVHKTAPKSATAPGVTPAMNALPWLH